MHPFRQRPKPLHFSSTPSGLAANPLHGLRGCDNMCAVPANRVHGVAWLHPSPIGATACLKNKIIEKKGRKKLKTVPARNNHTPISSREREVLQLRCPFLANGLQMGPLCRGRFFLLSGSARWGLRPHDRRSLFACGNCRWLRSHRFGSIPQWSSYVKDLLIHPHFKPRSIFIVQLTMILNVD